MADARAMTRVLDELLWVLRRGGFAIATSQAIDVVRAARAVGFDKGRGHRLNGSHRAG